MNGPIRTVYQRTTVFVEFNSNNSNAFRFFDRFGKFRMSLPKEWSLQAGDTEYMDIENEEVINVNSLDSENGFSGSLFSVHSAPVYELNLEPSSPKRPSSIVIPVTSDGNYSSLHIISPDPLDDDDNLLTISSLTAKPLIAKSRELRLSKAQKKKKTNEENNEKCDAKVPDGGYGWVVVFGAFFVQFWVAGLVKSYGVLFVEVMETYKDSSASVASWIPAILSALCLALGMFFYNSFLHYSLIYIP